MAVDFYSPLLLFDHLTAVTVSSVGSNPARGKFVLSQVLLASVSSVFSRGISVFTPTNWSARLVYPRIQ